MNTRRLPCLPFLLAVFLSSAVKEATPQADADALTQLGRKVLESFREEFEIGAA
jgi:hypothetical protein